ncbi:LysR family transcriptional regulator [Anaerostipes sp.]|uniref:LysR family transcriptional regulator n=1 Tax=Anaerostipes sp. TaxID=1872530 RepID=UPI0025C03813|nr:LysR family transcriptional regulator [Anaerostipes sp.]MBS7009905.1 LysR family transcriptional regulator [Anaerostipes sp.]
MTIRRLYVFKTVCDEGSITKAAEKLYMTQPAVSHVIHELEKELGTVLFDRISKKVFLNQTGKLFLKKSVRILELYEDLENGIYDLEKQAVLRVGASITISNFWLPRAMKQFKEKYPDTPVNVQVCKASDVLSMLQNNEIDLALIEGAVSEKMADSIAFSSFRLFVFCSPNHPWADMEEVELARLLEQPLLLREKGSATRDVLDSVLLLHDLKAEPFWTSVNSQVLIQAAKEGLGITVLPERLAEHEVVKGTLKKIGIKDIELKNDNHIVVYKDKYRTEPMKDFIHLLLEENENNCNL